MIWGAPTCTAVAKNEALHVENNESNAKQIAASSIAIVFVCGAGIKDLPFCFRRRLAGRKRQRRTTERDLVTRPIMLRWQSVSPAIQLPALAPQPESSLVS